MIEEHITFENGVRMVVPRRESPKDTGSGPVKPIVVDPWKYLDNYVVGPDGPPPARLVRRSSAGRTGWCRA